MRTNCTHELCHTCEDIAGRKLLANLAQLLVHPHLLLLLVLAGADVRNEHLEQGWEESISCAAQTPSRNTVKGSQHAAESGVQMVLALQQTTQAAEADPPVVHMAQQTRREVTARQQRAPCQSARLPGVCDN